jgi:hypothetical protein
VSVVKQDSAHEYLILAAVRSTIPRNRSCDQNSQLLEIRFHNALLKAALLFVSHIIKSPETLLGINSCFTRSRVGNHEHVGDQPLREALRTFGIDDYKFSGFYAAMLGMSLARTFLTPEQFFWT